MALQIWTPSHNDKRIQQFKKMVHGLPQLHASTIVCTYYIIRKQHRNPIPNKRTWRASQRLQLILDDICGPITPISNIKNRYLVSFIDDFSKNIWIYFLIEKSEVFMSFKYFKICVEKEIDSYIKCLRTNHRGNFNSKEFNKF